MGKDKKNKFKATPFDYMKGGRIEKMGERYGVDKSDYNVNFSRDNGRYKGGREEYEAAIAKAAMSDYDTRRTMEAQALSGKKKARKYAEEGFGNIQDVIKANNMRERWHKKAGNGGSFSSASDFAGQTMRAVDRERKNFTEDIKGMIPEQKDTATADNTDEKKEIVLSDHMQKAKDRVDQWEGSNFNIYNPAAATAQKTGNAGSRLSQEIDIANVGSSEAAAQDFLKDKKDRVKGEYKFSPVR